MLVSSLKIVNITFDLSFSLQLIFSHKIGSFARSLLCRELRKGCANFFYLFFAVGVTPLRVGVLFALSGLIFSIMTGVLYIIPYLIQVPKCPQAYRNVIH